MKKVVITIVLAFSFNCAFAQLLHGLLNSPNQQLVENAVKEGILLVKQEYQLLDTVTNTKYGRNHQEMFGIVYSMALKAEKRYIVTDEFLHPWRFDKQYADLQNNEYKPIISKTQIKVISDSTLQTLVYNSANFSSIKDSVLYSLDSIGHSNGGFSTDTSFAGEQDGWLVWVTYKDKLTDSTPFSLVFSKRI